MKVVPKRPDHLTKRHTNILVKEEEWSDADIEMDKDTEVMADPDREIREHIIVEGEANNQELRKYDINEDGYMEENCVGNDLAVSPIQLRPICTRKAPARYIQPQLSLKQRKRAATYARQGTPLQERRFDMRSETQDCGKCRMCRDIKKFGGPGR